MFRAAIAAWKNSGAKASVCTWWNASGTFACTGHGPNSWSKLGGNGHDRA